MATTIRRLRLCRTDAAGTAETIHFETDSETVLRPNGTTVEASLKALASSSSGGGTITQEVLEEAIVNYFSGSGSSSSGGTSGGSSGSGEAGGKTVVEKIVKEYLAEVAAGKADDSAATQKAVEDIVKNYLKTVSTGNTSSGSGSTSSTEFVNAVTKVLTDNNYVTQSYLTTNKYATEKFVTDADTALRKELVDKINSGSRDSDPISFTLAIANWTKNPSPETSDVAYYQDIMNNTVTSADSVSVNISPATATVATTYLSGVETLDGKVRVYAKAVPNAEIVGEYIITYRHTIEES